MELGLIAFVGPSVREPLPQLSLSGWDQEGGDGGGRGGRRDSSPMREGTAPPQPCFGILCAGNEKPSVAMETASPCSLYHFLWAVPVCKVDVPGHPSCTGRWNGGLSLGVGMQGWMGAESGAPGPLT